MSQYILRKVKFSTELAKFEDTDRPIDVYTIREKKCNCPSRYRSCKHVKIAAEWEKNGCPLGVVYDDTAKHIGVLDFLSQQ